jgi:tRNA-specific 2-thiouridylase
MLFAMSTRVVVAMSGGVDSSMAAYLLKQAGYDVVGVTMRLSTVEDPQAPPQQRRCCTAEDVDDARSAASFLGIPHYVVNYEKEFKSAVIDYFVGEYRRGRTPHPCIACNERVKFSPLLARVETLGAQFLATGHYARVCQTSDGSFHLLKARDASKDQSYVLYTLGQAELRRVLFPVGDYSKSELRATAAAIGLPNATKPDSQEICFVPHGSYRDFLRERVTPSPGRVIDLDGNDLGAHDGIEFYTVGQRRALGVQRPTPVYVLAVDADTRTVVVGDGDELMKHTLYAADVHLTSGNRLSGPMEVTAKVRYKAMEAVATISPHDNGAIVHFHEPQRALTPGQAVVFYNGEELMGGGTIDKVPLRADLGKRYPHPVS